MFYKNIKNKLTKAFVSIAQTPSKNINTVFVFCLLVASVISGLSALTLLNNSGLDKTANAAPICNAANGGNAYFNTSDNLCHEDLGFAGNKCFDFDFPDGNGVCNANQDILWNCAINKANQVLFYGGGNGQESTPICSNNEVLSRGIVSKQFCKWNSSVGGANGFDEATNMTKMLNYTNVQLDNDSRNAIDRNNSFCKTGTGCPSGNRLLVTRGTNRHGSNGFWENTAMDVICVNQSFWNGSSYFSGSPSVFLSAAGTPGSYVGDRTCGSSNNIAQTYDGGGHLERIFICSNNYTASVKYCLNGYNFFNNSPSSQGCFRTFAPTSFTCPAGQYLTNTGADTCTICTPGFFCSGGIGAILTQCPAGTASPAGSGLAEYCTPTSCPTGKVSTAGVCELPANAYSDVKFASTATGPETTTINASPGTSIYERIYYNNTSAGAMTYVAIKAALPSGFAYTPGSFKHCKVPTSADIQCDTQTPVVKDDMFSTLVNTGISPASTFYDGADSAAGGLGTAATSTKGILDAGKKKFLNLNSCHYNTGGSRDFDSLITNTAGTYGSDANSANNNLYTESSCRVGNSETGFLLQNGYPKNYKGYEIGLKKNLFLSQCSAVTATPFNSFTVWTNVDPQLKSNTQTTNSDTASGTDCDLISSVSFTIDAPNIGSNKVSLLGNRYLNFSQCVYNNITPIFRTNLLSGVTNQTNGNRFGSAFTASNTPITAFNCDIGGNGFNRNDDVVSYKAIDMLDTSRAKGFFEFRITVPNNANQPTAFTQNVTMSGKDSAGAALVPVVKPGYITTAGQASSCLAGQYYDGANTSCVICPADAFCGAGVSQPTLCATGLFAPQGSSVATACTTTVVTVSSSSSSTTATTAAVKFQPKVFLAGAFLDSTDLMNNKLRTTNLIPTAQPYNTPQYGNYNGGETLTNPSTSVQNIVDWVIVELRNPTTNAVQFRKAALLLTNGLVVDTSFINAVTTATPTSYGSQPGVSFAAATAGDYKVSIRHRNHIGISTKNLISLDASNKLIDFTTDPTSAKNNNQAKIGNIGIGTTGVAIYGMRAGNANGDNSINSTDKTLVGESPDTANTYSLKDLTLDGSINSTDRTVVFESPDVAEAL